MGREPIGYMPNSQLIMSAVTCLGSFMFGYFMVMINPNQELLSKDWNRDNLAE